MGEQREGIIFFRSWRDAIREIPEDKRVNAYEAIIDYALDGTVPEASGLIKMVFLMAKPSIDKNEKAYRDGKKGGRPPGSTKKPGSANNKTMVSENKNPPFFKPQSKEKEKATATDTDDVTATEEEEAPKPALTPARVSTQTIFNACLMAYPISKELQETMESWLKYKTERRESYKEQSLRTLMKKASEAEQKYGTLAVIDTIDNSIANRYQGIIWDRLGGRASPGGGGRTAKVNQFTQMEQQQDYDFDALEKELSEI